MDAIRYSDAPTLTLEGVEALYRAVGWSAAEKPERLLRALRASDALAAAYDGETLVGLGNALSDGCLVVYYPHLLVRPDYRRRGIGGGLLAMLNSRYEGFHQQAILASREAVGFYRSRGFQVAEAMTPMWIYAGADH